ncbi:MAG: TonB family protein [Acidobacteriota bacterium]|nr:TonB family protein [Acidobacteriota bacterium]
MKKLILTIVFLTVCSIHAQSDNKETIEQINRNAISLYRSGKFEEALKLARQVVDLSFKVYGGESQETATAYLNLGMIYREKKKLKESIENLQKAVDIYQRVPNIEGKQLIAAYDKLSYSQFLDDKKEDAEASHLMIIEIVEKKFGKESKENLLATLNMANFYARDKKFEKADEFYLKTYDLAIKNFGKEAEEIEQISAWRICMVATQKVDVESGKAFHEAKRKLFGEIPEQNKIVNGKATSLPKPPYPNEARSQRLSGTIAVLVKIDEQGNVTEAKALCGQFILGKAAEQAARGAKFAPTMKDGKPIKISGFIVYNFIS